ncbi:MAG TPA: L,D-transpeptidase family protein [Novosphingobium sp.]
MPGLLNNRTMLGGAFVGLAAIAAGMLIMGPPKDEAAKPSAIQASKPSAAGVVPPAKVAAAPAPGAGPAAPADERFVIKRILPINGPIKYGEWHWDDKNVPDGPIVMTVDLDARVISVFKGGYEIGASAVLLGSDDKPTPLGVFPITEKQEKHTSNLYDAEMPYMQRLTNDGITLHATKVAWGYVSHGCVGMPLDFAKKVFETTHVGDKVYITRGKMVGLGASLTS